MVNICPFALEPFPKPHSHFPKQLPCISPPAPNILAICWYMVDGYKKFASHLNLTDDSMWIMKRRWGRDGFIMIPPTVLLVYIYCLQSENSLSLRVFRVSWAWLSSDPWKGKRTHTHEQLRQAAMLKKYEQYAKDWVDSFRYRLGHGELDWSS